MARATPALPPGACDAHMHIFDPRFAPSAHWKRNPPIADVTAYRQLQQRLGLQRAVVVTPSTYGVDNACTLDALDHLGDCARGVAVVDLDVSDAELRQMRDRRVRGVRVNFVTPQPWGITTPERLQTIANRVAPFDWHVQVFALAGQIAEMATILARLPVPVVIDHLGRLDWSDSAGSPAVDAVKALLDGGKTWLKISGVYMGSRAGPPTYADMMPVARTLITHAPERMVWGTDWPHTTEPAGSVHDADMLDVLSAWCESDVTWARVLVDNPARLYGFD